MKILYLCLDLGIPVLGRKGASVHVRGLISALQRAGHRVVVAAQMLNKCLWEEPAMLEAPIIELKISNSTVNTIQALKNFNLTLGSETTLPGEIRRILFNEEVAADLKRKFENDPPDFIYERATLFGTAGASVARELNIPHVLELNAPLTLEQSTYRMTVLGPLAMAAERLALLQADAVLTVSGPLRDHALSLGVDPSRLHVFPNGVDPCLFRPGHRDPTVRARFGLADERVVGFVGGLRPWHGVEVLPDLLQRLLERRSDVRLLVVGDGPLRSSLQERLQQMGLGDKSVFAGSLPHTDVASVMHQFDVALAPYPALDHAFYFSPLKLFEYMACGVPVVASELGQIGEIVRHEETGLLCPPGDTEALAEACERLLADQELGRCLGEAAAKTVRNQFTWDHNAQRVGKLAQSLIARRRETNQQMTSV
jgi:glycosyltransferase involved in cell wall biosynthesis